MNLLEYVRKHKADFDTYDTEFDACITVCYIDEDDMREGDNYTRFCAFLMSKVEVEEGDGGDPVCRWSELIRHNMETFRAFTREYWKKSCQYPDDDDFIEAWLHEIHMYLAGYVSESFYAELVELAEELEPLEVE